MRNPCSLFHIIYKKMTYIEMRLLAVAKQYNSGHPSRKCCPKVMSNMCNC